jgi:hypothetical protein
VPLHAANPAVSLSVSPCTLEPANWLIPTPNAARESPSDPRTFCRSRLRAVEAEISRQDADEYFVPICVCLFISRLCSVTASGLSGARRRGVVLLRLITPAGQKRTCQGPRLRRLSGHGSSLKGALQESTTWHLGAGPTRLAPPGVTRARSGNSKKEYHNVPEQSKPHRLSRQRC